MGANVRAAEMAGRNSYEVRIGKLKRDTSEICRVEVGGQPPTGNPAVWKIR